MYPLTDRRVRLAQAQRRLEHSEAVLKLKERKARISNFIRIGEILEKCKMSTFDHRILAGGFLFLKKHLNDPKTLAEWTEAGDPYVQKPVVVKKEPPFLQVVFSTLPPEEIRKSLWSMGFKCETSNHIWEGKGIKKDIELTVGSYGNVYRMKTKKVEAIVTK